MSILVTITAVIVTTVTVTVVTVVIVTTTLTLCNNIATDNKCLPYALFL